MADTLTLTPERLLRRLEWRVVRRLDGRLQGDYRSLVRGAGLDVTDLREYAPGDDMRHIEWNVTARLDSPYVRIFDEDREITTWLLLDLSASMGFGPVDRQKDLVVAEVATVLARVLTRGGGRVGAILLGSGIKAVIHPASGRNQVLRIAAAALHHGSPTSSTPPTRSTEEQPTERPRGWQRLGRLGRRRTESARRPATDLSVLLSLAEGLARRRSLVVVVSDFISVDGWERPLGRLARRHEVVALRVTDPRESELPDVGAIYVEDVETGEQIFVDTADPGFRQRLRVAADEQRIRVEGLARRSGVDVHSLSTDEDLVRALARVSDLRRRKRG